MQKSNIKFLVKAPGVVHVCVPSAGGGVHRIPAIIARAHGQDTPDTKVWSVLQINPFRTKIEMPQIVGAYKDCKQKVTDWLVTNGEKLFESAKKPNKV